jgi:hypothetical protein
VSTDEAVAAEIAEPEGVLIQELRHGDAFFP